MKNIARALVILLLIYGAYVLFIQYGSAPQKKTDQEEPQVSNEEESGKRLKMPSSGLLSLMGKSAADVKRNLGNRPGKILLPTITSGGCTTRGKTNTYKSVF